MHERLPRAADRLEGALDLLGAGLGEDLEVAREAGGDSE